ncbi:MAG: hypothetical protein WKF96_15175 [Solirubrobacteraceae bacterium]
MSQISLARATRRRVLLAGLAAAAATAGLSAAAQDAQAAFTLGPCAGASNVRGQGASFQNGAQAYFRQVFNSSNGCNGTPTAPTYLSNGSGNGIASAGGGVGNAQLGCVASGCTVPLPPGNRDPTVSFQATDEPPSVEQQAAMNRGTAPTSDDATVRVIPVGTGANVVIIHAPEGCDLSTITNKTNGADGTVGSQSTGDTAADKTQRLRIPNILLEKAFAGDTDADLWGEIAPGISGTPTNAQEAGIADCAAVPVKRIVRQDVSGTTFGFKAYLQLIRPQRAWLTTYSTPDNRQWPAAGGTGTATPTLTGGTSPSPAFCPNTDANRLCSGRASGNGPLVDAVNATDGSIGYSDIDTARKAFFEISPSATTQDYTFWLPAQNNPGGTPTGYAEGTTDARAHKPGVGGKGSNCANVTVSNVPTPAGSPRNDPTLGDWTNTFAAGGPVYGLCVLTYILAWDDNAPVYGNTADEQAKARTVKDFLTTIVGSFGQQFANVDYSPLPNPQSQPLLKYAQDAVNAIDWNKTATAQGPGPSPGPGPAPVPVPVPGPGPGVVPPRPPVVTPSNRYTVSSGRLNPARTTITYTVKVPGRGALRAVSSYVKRGKTVKVSTVSLSPSGASTVRVTVKLTSRNRADLKRLKRLRVATRFTYTPTGGTAASQRKAVNIRRR